MIYLTLTQLRHGVRIVTAGNDKSRKASPAITLERVRDGLSIHGSKHNRSGFDAKGVVPVVKAEEEFNVSVDGNVLVNLLRTIKSERLLLEAIITQNGSKALMITCLDAPEGVTARHFLGSVQET